MKNPFTSLQNTCRNMRKEAKKGMFKDDKNTSHRARGTVGKEVGSVSWYGHFLLWSKCIPLQIHVLKS